MKKRECITQRKDGTLQPCEVMKDNEQLKWEIKEITEDNDYYQKVNNEQTEVILKLNAHIETLKKTYRNQRNKRIDELQKENTELRKKIETKKCCFTCEHKDDCVIEDYNNVCEKWE